jgi:hypothetical protein
LGFFYAIIPLYSSLAHLILNGDECQWNLRIAMNKLNSHAHKIFLLFKIVAACLKRSLNFIVGAALSRTLFNNTRVENASTKSGRMPLLHSRVWKMGLQKAAGCHFGKCVYNKRQDAASTLRP